MAKLFLDGKKMWAWLLLLVLFVNGCATTGDTGSTTNGGGGAVTTNKAVPPGEDPLRVDDLVVVIFQNATDLTTHEERIKEDGTITLKYIGVVQAAGKTRGQLQKDIQAAYVPKYYPNLVATVKAEDRFFFVGGEVKIPNRYIYSGQQTVLRAITTAGGFTEYAAKQRVELTRVDGKRLIIDCKKAQKSPELDLPIFPGDKIEVPRRIL